MAVFRTDRKERVKAVPGYGGRYRVGDLGRVYSGGSVLSLIKGRYVNLSYGGEVKRVDVAYLVARAFLSNLEGRPYVWHKDGDVRNNRVENLEWREVRQEIRGRWPDRRRAVMQFDRSGVCVGYYASVTEAVQETGVSRSQILRSLRGESRGAKGWTFRFV